MPAKKKSPKVIPVIKADDYSSEIFSPEEIKEILEPTPIEALEEYELISGFKLCGVRWTYYHWKLNKVLGIGGWETSANMEYIKIDTKEGMQCCAIPVMCLIKKKLEGETGPFSTRTVWECETVGNAVARDKTSIGDLIKAAITDGTKKGFSQLGFFHDVYIGAVSLPEETKPKKKKPRSGKTQIQSEEDQTEAKNMYAEMQKALNDLKIILDKKDIKGKGLNRIETEAILLNKQSLLSKMSATLIHAAKKDDLIAFDESQELKTFQDIHSLHEWQIIKTTFLKWIAKVKESGE